KISAYRNSKRSLLQSWNAAFCIHCILGLYSILAVHAHLVRRFAGRNFLVYDTLGRCMDLYLNCTHDSSFYSSFWRAAFLSIKDRPGKIEIYVNMDFGCPLS